MRLLVAFASLSAAAALLPGAAPRVSPPRTMHAGQRSSPVVMASSSRRQVVAGAALAATALGSAAGPAVPAAVAAAPTTVFVAGATGQTGRRVLQRLAAKGGLTVTGGVRSVDKATKALAESKVEVRGLMVEKGAAIDTKGVELRQMDVVADDVAALSKKLEGANALVIATGFVPV